MVMSMLKTENVIKNQQGFASLVIALVLIIVLSLLTVGFAQLARREQQNALDKQLATQAYYAAETGVNDAIYDLQHHTLTGSINTCGAVTPVSDPGGKLLNDVVNNSAGASYPCVLVQVTPASLPFTNVDSGESRSITFQPSSSAPLPIPSTITLTINWQNSTSPLSLPPAALGHNFPQRNSWNYPAVMQFGVTPFNGSGPITRGSLMGSTFAAYFYPAGSGSAANYATSPTNTGATSGDFGKILNAQCSVTGNSSSCSAQITNIPYDATNNTYLIHIMDFYKLSAVTITANDSSGSPINFKNSIWTIDVTGKAQNVLKRIQVSVPQSAPAWFPGQAVIGDVCKHMQTQPGGTNFYNASGISVNSGDCYLEN